MNHIDQVVDIIYDLTGYTPVKNDFYDYSTIYISPSLVSPNLDLIDVEYFNAFLKEKTLAAIETMKRELLRLRWDYSYSQRGYLSVLDGSTFDEGDNVIGGTSGATGTVYKIDGNTLYLKNVEGTWQSGENITDNDDSTSTTSSLLHTLSFPFFIDVKVTRFNYDVSYNESVGTDFFLELRIEGRWSL